MSRKSSQKVSRVQDRHCNSKHNTPLELIPITDKIESLKFVKEIGKAKWKPRSSDYYKEIHVTGFDDNQKSISINIYGERFEQKFFIKVNFPKDRCLLESKCIEMIGAKDVKRGGDDSYYYDLLKNFYAKTIIGVVENFYKD